MHAGGVPPTASWVKVGSQDWKKDHRWQSDKAQAETYIVQARAVGGPACHSGAAPAPSRARLPSAHCSGMSTTRTLSAILGTLSAIFGTIRAILGSLRASIGSLSAILGTLSAILGTLSAIIGTPNAAVCRQPVPRRREEVRPPALLPRACPSACSGRVVRAELNNSARVVRAYHGAWSYARWFRTTP